MTGIFDVRSFPLNSRKTASLFVLLISIYYFCYISLHSTQGRRDLSLNDRNSHSLKKGTDLCLNYFSMLSIITRWFSFTELPLYVFWYGKNGFLKRNHGCIYSWGLAEILTNFSVYLGRQKQARKEKAEAEHCLVSDWILAVSWEEKCNGKEDWGRKRSKEIKT